MADTKATFNIFGPTPGWKNIRVGYISTDRGYVSGMDICAANAHAQKNPGSVFVYKPNRKKVQFLNINEVNSLKLDPSRANTDTTCPDGLQLESTCKGAEVVFIGGGGVGVTANPVIGDDGSVMAVHVVSKGFGYQHPPLVEVRDDCGIGAGAVTRAIMGFQETQMIYYDDKEDFENYEICAPEGQEIIGDLNPSPQGRRWGPDGRDLGTWNPGAYTSLTGEEPFKDVVDQYIKQVQQSGSNWFTTRKFPPLDITSSGGSRKAFYEVKHPSWGEFMDNYAISPVSPSNVKGSDNAGKWYSFEWEVTFPYEGEYIFHLARDNKTKFYIDGVSYTESVQTFTGTDLTTGEVGPAQGPWPPGTPEFREAAEAIVQKRQAFASIRWKDHPAYTGDFYGPKLSGAQGGVAGLAASRGYGTKLTMTAGTKVLRLDLYNEPIMKDVLVQQTVGTAERDLGPWDPDSDEGREVAEAKVQNRKAFASIRWKDHPAYTGDYYQKRDNIKNRSTDSKGSRVEEVFNTVDYISKANRKLWRTNVYARGGFLNDYGICPFDTKLQLRDNPYAGTHKIVWSNVNFPVSGDYDIQVAVDDNVDLRIGDQVVINKKGFTGDTDQSTGILKVTKYITKGNHDINADLFQKEGGAFGFKKPDGSIVKKAKVKFNVNVQGQFGNRISIPGLFSVGKDYKGSSASMNQEIDVEVGKEYDVVLTSIRDEGAEASGEVRSGAIRFRDTSGNIKNEGSRLEYEDRLGSSSRGARDHQDIKVFASQGRFYGVNGNRCKFMMGETIKGINPMALAIDIKTSVTQKRVQADKSWNENPMGVALTIDAPAPPIPQEPVPQQQGRCPNNPFWTTRFPGAKERWHPVRDKHWNRTTYRSKPPKNPAALGPWDPNTAEGREVAEAKVQNRKAFAGIRWKDHPAYTGDFYKKRDEVKEKSVALSKNSMLNQYGVSPVPPYDELNTSSGGIKYQNTWTRGFPYSGWYKAKLEADDFGELWIDDEKVLEYPRDVNNDGIAEKMVYIDGPELGETPTNHDIKVVVENSKKHAEIFKKVNTKVFSTIDWLGGGTAQAQKKKVNFKITSSSDFANSITIPELDISAKKRYKGPQISHNSIKDVEVNKVYKVHLKSAQSKTGVRLRNRGESVLVMEEGFGSTQSQAQVKVKKHEKVKNFKPKNVTIQFYVREKAAAHNKIFLTGPNGKTITFDSRRTGYHQVKLKTNTDYEVTTWSSCKQAYIEAQNGGRRVGLDDCKPGGDDDYNDLTVEADRGLFFGMNRGRKGKFRFSDGSIETITTTDTVTKTTETRTGTEDWDDIICSASEGRFYDFNPGANDASCKFIVTAPTTVAGGIKGGTTKHGVTYQGPHIFHYQDNRWGKVINKEGISPIGSPQQSLTDPNNNILGNKILEWKNVNFPQTGTYQITFVADNMAELFVDGKKVLTASNNFTQNNYVISEVVATEGKHDIKISLNNAQQKHSEGKETNVFVNNPTGVMLRIYTVMDVLNTGHTKSWKENPIGVSAKLIPPPCPKLLKGKGVIPGVVVDDPGNGYKRDAGPGYPAKLKLKAVVIKDPGINYNCATDNIRLEPANGSQLSLCQCGPFGKIEKVCIEKAGYFTRMPDVIVDSDTGVNLEVALQFEPEIVPPDIIDDVIQVTDLVGLKQTGYYKGKPYYGAVFYENGVKYSGWYRTAGEMIQVYDTLQESIDAEVTTPPSAILRQGSDVNSNDPRLDLPGTPNNLT